jgi:hypothetical protein
MYGLQRPRKLARGTTLLAIRRCREKPMTSEGDEKMEGTELEAPALREPWSTPTLYRTSASQAELTASDSGGDIVWS